MIASLRSAFNRRYRPEQYRALKRGLDAATRTHISFRVAETPCFLPLALIDTMAAAGAELTHRLVDDPAYLAQSAAVIPAQFRAPDETPHPHFMTVDFGLVREADGSITPRLVELQGFPSVYGYQFVLNAFYRDVYELNPDLECFLGGHTEHSFWRLMRRIIVGGHDPENVVLAEVDPEQQKTLPDFLITAERLGIRIVNVRDIVAEPSAKGSTRLFYREGRRLVPIHRIYNRAIVDEIVNRKVELPFDYRESLDVEWAGHPNWYFHLSKFSIPFLDHPLVPAGVFLDDWFAGRGRERLPEDREDCILKPLFSFAGKGIEFAPSDALLDSIPAAERHGYLLQRRMRFEPLIETPFGLTQAEVRILYLWPDGHDLEPVLTLVRLGRGKMMGVDHNRDREWVGASAAFYPDGEA